MPTETESGGVMSGRNERDYIFDTLALLGIMLTLLGIHEKLRQILEALK